MTKSILKALLIVTGEGRYAAEASELGFGAGVWPDILLTDEGARFDFDRFHPDSEGEVLYACYIDRATGHGLTIFND